MGYEHLLKTYIASVERDASTAVPAEIQQQQFEAAWREGVWDPNGIKPVPESTLPSQPTFPQHLCSILTVFAEEFPRIGTRRGNDGSLGDIVQKARTGVMSNMLAVASESASNLYPVLVRFQSLVEIEELFHALGDSTSPAPLNDLQQRWGQRLDTTSISWQTREPLIALRAALLNIVRLGAKDPASPAAADIRDMLSTTLKVQAGLGRVEGRFQSALSVASALQYLSETVKSKAGAANEQQWAFRGSLQSMLIKCECYWERGEQQLAKRMLLGLIAQLEESPRYADSELAGVCRRICGTWLASTQSKKPDDIINDYLNKSTEKLGKLYHDGGRQSAPSIKTELIKSHLELAKYTDEQYKLKLEDAQRFKEEDFIGHAKREIEMFDKNIAKTKDKSQMKSKHSLKKQLQIEEAEQANIQAALHEFCSEAINNYLKCLRMGDDCDMQIFRVCALWFGANDGKTKDVTARAIKQAELPWHKWLPLIYQLAARLGSEDFADQQGVLRDLVLNVAYHHPHHVMFVLIALCNGDYAHQTGKGGKGKAKQEKHKPMSLINRVDAANKLVETMKTSRTPDYLVEIEGERNFTMPVLIEAMQKLSTAYIELADLQVDVKNLEQYKNKFQLAKAHDAKCKKMFIPNLEKVAVLTTKLEVDRTCTYKNAVGIKQFGQGFKTAGGINLPKILTCTGSDGHDYKQLVKGKDDMRQDAVVQQTFEMVNVWLKDTPATRQRRLRIGTYRIVPLSQESGVLEWCEGTVPIGMYLVRTGDRSKKSAHERYRPTDWTTSDCREKLKNGRPFEDKRSREHPKSKLSVYKQVCKNFKPVMRRFFTEKFREPSDWFEKRLAYTRSVAASSIVGYILGLGDRHNHNILINETTAELTHIDLGIAFEQGKRLNTPETIPFRLTRDIVDGMGVTGTEGVFRLCCQETMHIMRKQQESLLTILEVFFADPLMSLQLSADKAQAVQKDDDEEGSEHVGVRGQKNDADGASKEAQRVLLRVRQKLDGAHSGARLSVEGHVNCLIEEATSEVNLCQLFPGWAPWV